MNDDVIDNNKYDNNTLWYILTAISDFYGEDENLLIRLENKYEEVLTDIFNNVVSNEGIGTFSQKGREMYEKFGVGTSTTDKIKWLIDEFNILCDILRNEGVRI